MSDRKKQQRKAVNKLYYQNKKLNRRGPLIEFLESGSESEPEDGNVLSGYYNIPPDKLEVLDYHSVQANRRSGKKRSLEKGSVSAASAHDWQGILLNFPRYRLLLNFYCLK
jgi:hypothetical protein